MDSKRSPSELTFTLEEPAGAPVEPQQEDFDWERGLEQLRERRHSDAPQSETRVEPTPVAVKPVRAVDKSHAKAQEKALREYLLQWQQTHNESIPEEEGAETDTTVLLQEDWLAAQTALQAADEGQVLKTHTVWLNPKRQNVTEPAQTQNPTQHVPEDEALPDSEGMPVIVQVLDPQVAAHQPVMCLSESELMARLSKRLRPHLTDAVNGMVRVAVQKQAAALTYQLQQNLNEQTPALVDEILEYNLKAVMSEIKYDLKFKRRQ